MIGSHSQVARNGRARRSLCRVVGRAVLVRLTEAGAVHEAERLRVIQQRVEHRAGVEDGDLVEVVVLRLECMHVLHELLVVVRERRSNFSNLRGALLDQ